MSKEEIMRRMTAIHQVDWAFAVLLVVDTFSLSAYSSLPPPVGPAGGAILTGVVYAMCVVTFLIGVLGQSLIGRFIGWYFALYLLITSLMHPFLPSDLIPLYSPQRACFDDVFSLIPYVLVSVYVTKAYMTRVQQVSSPEDYFHSVSSFACEKELKESTRRWKRRFGPFVVVVFFAVYPLSILALWIMSKLT
jgi:uncharacterized membrane protein